MVENERQRVHAAAPATTTPSLPRTDCAARRRDDSWAAKNPEVLAFVCGGLFGLVPSASTFLAAPPDELARAVAAVATTPIWTSGRWPFLGFIPVLSLAASGALAEFTTIRVLTASTAIVRPRLASVGPRRRRAGHGVAHAI